MLHLHARAVHGDVSALRSGALVFKAQQREGMADLLLTQRLGNVAADELQGHRGRYQFTGLLAHGLAEVQVDELQLRMLRFELFVMAFQPVDLRLLDPVLEALLVEGVGL